MILKYVNGTKEYGVCTSQLMILGLLVTLTVIGQEVLMTERVGQDMFFIWVREPFHGLP